MMHTLYVVGFGPGGYEHMTQKAIEVMKKVDVIVGYTTYVEMVKEYFPEQTYQTTPMRKETERCIFAIEEVEQGKDVALISSGDSGIYGMAGIALQLVQERGSNIQVEIVPGMTAASVAASVLGAPLMHDFAIISLSDLVTPLDLIMKRVECAAMGDLIVCFYNPRSKKRNDYIIQAAEKLLLHQKGSTPVGVVRHAGRPDEESFLTTLEELRNFESWEEEQQKKVDMFTMIIVGNSSTYIRDGKMITPRGYQI